MRVADLIRMSIANLWARRWRTALNLIGVLAGSMLMILMVAGTRGVSCSVYALLDSNHSARIIYVLPYVRTDGVKVPEDVYRVEGEIDAIQRKLIGKRLEQDWNSKNTIDKDLTLELAESFLNIEHVEDVVPTYVKTLEILLDGKQLTRICSGISSTDPQLKSDLIAGTLPSAGENRILINRFLAYQLGCINDSEINNLIGKKLILRYRARSEALEPKTEGSETEPEAAIPANRLVNSLGYGRVIEALSSLQSRLHELSLPTDQKLVLSQALSSWLDLYKPMSHVDRDFEICGVVKLMESTGFLENMMWYGSQPDDIAMHHTVINSLLDVRQRKVLDRGAKIRVDSLAKLVRVEKLLTEQGLQCASLKPFLEHFESRLTEARWVLSLIGLIIFSITALFISNSMVMSVLERTTEFGIMKALGASGRQIMGMMLWEGAMLGVAGSVIAAIASVIFAGGIELLVQRYVSIQLGSSFAENVFLFSWVEILVTVSVAVIFCTTASVFPAYRASRLNPIHAIRNS